MRKRRMPTSTGRHMATRIQLLEPGFGSTANILRETTTVESGSCRHRTTLATHAMALASTLHGSRDHPLSRHTLSLNSMATRHEQDGRTTRVERGGISAPTPAWLHTRMGAIGRTLRATSPHIASLLSLSHPPPERPRNDRNLSHNATTNAPWIATMTSNLHIMLGPTSSGLQRCTSSATL
jgi:hypothetical protein